MAALGITAATDLASGLLAFYVKEKMLSQNTQDKPLLKDFSAKSETFPGGFSYAISVPVQFGYMSDTAGFFQGYSGDDQLQFGSASNMLRASFNGKQHHAGLWITWDELKQDGVSVDKGQKTKQHSKSDLFQLASVLQNRLDDFGESWSRAVEHLFWMDGSQDAKAMPGLLSLIFDTPAVGPVGGLSPVTYPLWRNRANLGIAASGATQNLIRTLSQELIQIKRYGGKPTTLYMGSDFRNALELELRANGYYSQEGFSKDQDISIGDIMIKGVGKFKYEPWLDDHGRSKYCYALDTSKIKLRPMEDEFNKLITPERPYNYLVFLQSMVTTCAMQVTQRNAHEVFSVA